MPQKQRKNRTHHILRHLQRFRVSTAEVIHRLFYCHKRECSLNTVYQQLGRMAAKQLIRKHNIHNQVIYTLGPAALRRHRVSRRYLEISGQLAARLAVLHFCCCDPRQTRKRLLPYELKHTYPWMDHALLHLDFYLDHHHEEKRLALMFTDLSAWSVRKKFNSLRRKIYNWQQQYSEFRQLVDEDKILAVVITSSEREYVYKQLIDDEGMDVYCRTWAYDEPVSLSFAISLPAEKEKNNE